MDQYDLQDEIRKLEQKREFLQEKIIRIRNHRAVMPLGDLRRDTLEFELKEQEAKLNEVNEQITAFQGLMVYKSLLSLDYVDQTSLFLSFSRMYCIGAFILHGAVATQHDYRGYSMRALLKRLINIIPNSTATPLMHLDLSSPVLSSDIAALWRSLAVAVKLGTDAQREDIIKRVCMKLQTQHVILILRGVDYIPEEHLHNIIYKFWVPLATAGQQVRHPMSRHLLLMFIVDYSGRLTDGEIACAEKPGDGNWTPEIPIRLPVVTKFSANDLTQWMSSWTEVLFDVLPDSLRQGSLDIRIRSILEQSSDGIPDLVMSYICHQCGFYLEGAEECLRL